MTIKKTYIKINFGTKKRISFELPYKLYRSILLLGFSGLLFLLIANIFQAHLFLQTLLVENRKSHQEQTIAYYNDVLQKYSIGYAQKEQGLNQQLLSFIPENGSSYQFTGLIGVPENKVLGGIGGDGQDLNKSDLVERYTQDLIDRKLELFKRNQESKVIERDLASMEESVSAVSGFDVELGEEKMFLNYLPTLWPLKNQAGKVVEETRLPAHLKVQTKTTPKTYLELKVNTPAVVIATANGKVSKVKQDGNIYSVVIKHNFGISTTYKRLNNVEVKEGDILKKGDALGKTQSLIYKVQLGNKLEDPRKFTLFKY